MSRIKKSRTPRAEKRETVKETSKTAVTPEAKRPKQKKGKQPGNRQKEAFANNNKAQTNNAPKDSRIGSKTLIDLTPKSAPKVNQPQKEKPSPIAAIRLIEPVETIVSTSTSTLENELYAIEDDAQLQQILALQEDDAALNEEQINYFNEKMERHQELRELLGWNDEDDEDENDTESNNKSEDDLWDTLDNNDLSKF